MSPPYNLPTKVFVYGTLKRGFGNNRVLRDSEFLGSVTTQRSDLSLLNLGFPGLLEGLSDVPTGPVKGELFLVTDEKVMQGLDRLEGEGSLYFRRPITVEGDVEAQTYFLNPDHRYAEQDRFFDLTVSSTHSFLEYPH